MINLLLITSLIFPRKAAVLPEIKSPAIGTFFIDNDIIYMGTYLRQEENWIFYLYSIKGNFIKTLSLPLFDRHLRAPYPYYIKNGKLYQVLENEDTETWELHITEIQ